MFSWHMEAGITLVAYVVSYCLYIFAVTAELCFYWEEYDTNCIDVVFWSFQISLKFVAI